MKEIIPSEISIIFRLLFAFRELPGWVFGKEDRKVKGDEPLLEQFVQEGFVILEDKKNSEIVFGTIGQFWKLIPGKGPDLSSPKEFLDFNDPEYAKAGGNLLIIDSPDPGRLTLYTETRIFIPDPQTRKRFAVYWSIIKMGSAYIRRIWIKGIKKKAENM